MFMMNISFVPSICNRRSTIFIFNKKKIPKKQTNKQKTSTHFLTIVRNLTFPISPTVSVCVCVCVCVDRERERERERGGGGRELYPFPDPSTPKYIYHYSKLSVFVFSDLWSDYLVCFVLFCFFLRMYHNTFSDPANLSFGVPQGSVLGPILFIMYTKHLSSLIDSHSLCNQSFADDTQLYKSCTPSIIDQTIQTTQNCITDIKTWMTTHKLKLNDDKTEVLLIHTNRSFSSNTKPSSILVGNADITFHSDAT